MASCLWKRVHEANPFAEPPCSETEVKLFFKKIETKSPEEQYMLIHSLEMGKIFGYANMLIRDVIRDIK